MQQLVSVWTMLDLRKQVTVVLATLTMFAAVLGLSRMASQPSMALLYAGLESAAAGDVVKSLDASGAKYEVRGGAIYVESSSRDQLRMNLASEGLPANSGGGYEILDNLSGFGTTSQMFNAAYWRSQEGELARTIMASPMIEGARVHLGNPGSNGLRQRSVPTASVTITTSSGTLSASHAKALKYMIASAVPGLLPENVSVIDSQGGLILGGEEALTGGADQANLADNLRKKIERLLEARVGYGGVVVEVSVETITQTETIRERVIDPESRIAISSETEESSVSTSDSQGAGVTVASNLPSGEGANGGGEATSSTSETRERLNYEISETTREILRAPGAISRLSVAVLINEVRSIDDTGLEIWEPRSQEEMASLLQLVQSTVGFNEERGDVITLKNFRFEPLSEGTEAIEPGLFQGFSFDLMSLIQLAVLAVVSLVLGLFVIRPLLSSKGSVQNGESALIAPLGSLPNLQTSPTATGQNPSSASDQDVQNLPALTGEIDEHGAEFPEMATISDTELSNRLDGKVPGMGEVSLDPVDRLRALIEERQSETVEILRGWMENDEEKV